MEQSWALPPLPACKTGSSPGELASAVQRSADPAFCGAARYGTRDLDEGETSVAAAPPPCPAQVSSAEATHQYLESTNTLKAVSGHSLFSYGSRRGLPTFENDFYK